MQPGDKDRDLELFSQILRQARLAAEMSQLKLARTLGVTQTAISAWESAQAEPEREHVFALEAVLNTGAGGLSWPLGYGPVARNLDARRAKKLNTRQAIQLDPDLSEAAKEVLLKNYALLAGKRRRVGTSSGCTTAVEVSAA